MGNGHRMQVTKKTFEQQDMNGKMSILFDMQQEGHTQISELWKSFREFKQCADDRYARKGEGKWNRLYSFAGGLVGGIIIWASILSIKLGF